MGDNRVDPTRSSPDALRLLSPHPRPHRHARRHPHAGARRRAARPAFRDDRRPRRLPGRERIALSLHARRQASRRRRCAGDLLHPGRGGRRHGEAAARHLRAGAALPQPGADGEDGGVARRAVRRTRHAGRRRRLAEGGIRGAGQSRLRAARRRDRRMDRDLQAALDAARPPASTASSTNTPTYAASRSRCRSRIRRSGSAAIRAPRCAAPRGTATAGTRSAPSPPRRCRRRRCARICRR